MSEEYNDRIERGLRLDEETIAALKKLDDHVGCYVACRSIGISREAFARACAGMTIFPSTIAKINRYLARAGR